MHRQPITALRANFPPIIARLHVTDGLLTATHCQPITALRADFPPITTHIPVAYSHVYTYKYQAVRRVTVFLDLDLFRCYAHKGRGQRRREEDS